MKPLHTTALSLLICISLHTAQAQTPPPADRPSFVIGLKLNQGKTAATIGASGKLTNRLTLYGGTDINPTEIAPATHVLYRVTAPTRVQLYALLGPQLEILQNTPDSLDPIAYLTAATGILVSGHLSRDVALWTGATYLITPSNIIRWKFAFGLSIKLSPQ